MHEMMMMRESIYLTTHHGMMITHKEERKMVSLRRTIKYVHYFFCAIFV